MMGGRGRRMGQRKIHHIQMIALAHHHRAINAVYRAVVMSEGDHLDVMDFPLAHAPSTAPHHPEGRSEPLAFDPMFHSGAPATVSGNEIPIAPTPSVGSLVMLTSGGEVRPLEDMESEIIRFAISHYRGQMSEVARRL